MNILIVDDNTSLAKGLVIFLQQEGHQARMAGTVAAAQELMQQQGFDLVITDLKLPDGTGITVAGQARAQVPPAEVILMTAFGSMETAVEAMRIGALDYLTKPVPMEEFAFRIDRISRFNGLDRKAETLTRANHALREAIGPVSPLEAMVGKSPAMSAVKELIRKAAPFPSTVLLTGETGTGKEMAARAIHSLSPRPDGPFVRVNCASIPATLFESELFGHEKGAFTDARERRIGRFESSADGTLFLDEVGEVPLDLQAKLLRALQEKEIVRVGGTRPIIVNTRIIAATNRNLDEMVSRGEFREDLLYRLAVIRMVLPPLRERKEDIPAIADGILLRLGRDFGKPDLCFNDVVGEFLSEYDWPGNIRELHNAVERAVVLAEGNLITPADFFLPERQTAGNIDEPNDPEGLLLSSALAATERKLILRALRENNGVKARAAEQLGIPRTNLLYRLKKLGIAVE